MEVYDWGKNIRLDDSGRFLTADLYYDFSERTYKYNKTRACTVDLDFYLHNDNGRFAWNWPGVGFHATATDVRLDRRDRYGAGQVYIHAQLQTDAGGWREAQFCLDRNLVNLSAEGYFEVRMGRPGGGRWCGRG